MSYYNFKRIQVVPSANDFVDIILSKTQRKTPTVVHPNYSIGRIRQFYMRKVKFAQEAFNEKFQALLQAFPKLDDIHPFYSDLMNVLYDKDHYKLALGQLNTARHLVEQIAKDYVRLLKFGDSLYRCKQLKRAALGRMATLVKGLKDSLAYLEQVRQHLARLPSIDPNTRTLLVCGYPNVGKSSFMNKLTRADVEVQPYAFTTKSLFVGHMDYEYVRWQVIDTPGILDHPLEDRNTIEMQSITALAHLKAAILYFIDLSEQCGYSIKEQVSLFHSIRPLFANKPVLLVVNKIDVRRYEDLHGDEKQLVDSCLTDSVTLVQQSCWNDDGVMAVRNTACQKLLQMRVEVKMRSNKLNDVLSRLNVAQPQARDDKARPAFIPEKAKNRVKYDAADPNRPKLERDLEVEQGGPGVYSVDLKKKYLLANPDWMYDAIPEIMDGKNVADFVDPEIEERLAALELEEERLAAEGFYDSAPEEDEDSDMEDLKEAAEGLRVKRALIQQAAQIKKGKNRPAVPLGVQARSKTFVDLQSSLREVDMDPDVQSIRGRMAGQKRRRSAPAEMDADGDVEMSGGVASSSKPRAHSATRDRTNLGMSTKRQRTEAEAIKKRAEKQLGIMAKAGESDRHIHIKKPKHLFTGKRGLGTSDRR
ncbi:small GTP-binding protein domain [Allomyces macrogynus ATCC 38327]|uniref:Nucleolar GTP-binding protein 1 n=1 Tax=Allomyces macrogynus (strain ATCC 38327) TaxID=578462 RepID=A0A0L0S5Q3_ALLM3|nr:small GTP-binding protein domain [Allomyces macrogynus ATCC 38327]|eukprot:KNE57746.1 small GTP-binding protein domain [Allomyces macrogynus ATCC 38327]